MNDFRQYAIFNGNPHLSPFAVIFAVFGIFLMVFSPLGIILLVAAVVAQRRFRRRVGRMRREHSAVLAEREERAEIAAWKSL